MTYVCFMYVIILHYIITLQLHLYVVTYYIIHIHTNSHNFSLRFPLPIFSEQTASGIKTANVSIRSQIISDFKKEKMFKTLLIFFTLCAISVSALNVPETAKADCEMDRFAN